MGASDSDMDIMIMSWRTTDVYTDVKLIKTRLSKCACTIQMGVLDFAHGRNDYDLALLQHHYYGCV